MSIEDQLNTIKDRILNLGPMLPGSISEQWNVCGTPGCTCKAKKNPLRHGPYYQLSFSVQRRSSTLYIKKQDVAEVRKRLQRYKEFKKLSFELIRAYVDLVRTNGLKRS